MVGANDVTNPAARRPGSPVSGMPILNVDHARSIVVIKGSMGRGNADTDFCPSCGESLPCPRDAFYDALAPLALDWAAEAVRSFWDPERVGYGTGDGYTIMRTNSFGLADAVSRRALSFWDEHDPVMGASVLDSL